MTMNRFLSAAGVPVIVRGREVFRIYGPVGGFMAAERADSVARRLERIANDVVLAGAIVNYTKLAAAHGTILHTSVTIGDDAPWRQVHDLLRTAARRTDLVLAAPKPFVLQTSLDDSYVSYQINVYTGRPERMLDIYSWLHANIHDAFNKAGVEIMSPSYAALRDGNAITIPKAHRPEGYEAPGFRVEAHPPRQR